MLFKSIINRVIKVDIALIKKYNQDLYTHVECNKYTYTFENVGISLKFVRPIMVIIHNALCNSLNIIYQNQRGTYKKYRHP